MKSYELYWLAVCSVCASRPFHSSIGPFQNVFSGLLGRTTIALAFQPFVSVLTSNMKDTFHILTFTISYHLYQISRVNVIDISNICKRESKFVTRKYYCRADFARSYLYFTLKSIFSKIFLSYFPVHQ